MKTATEVARALPAALATACVLAGVPATGWAVTCPVVTLKSASDVPGMKQSYAVTGHCKRSFTKTETGVGTSTSETYSFDVDVAGKANWDRKTQLATELLKISGDATGVRKVTGICTQDPFLKDAPGGKASCKSINVQVDLNGGSIPGELVQKEFWLARTIALVEAQALAAKAPEPAPPPPPEPEAKSPVPEASGPSLGSAQGPSGTQPAVGAAQTGDRRATAPRRERAAPQQSGAQAPAARTTADGRALPPSQFEDQLRKPPSGTAPAMLNVEAEDLVKSGKFQLNGGKVVVQPMSGFGTGWSGGEHLFWSGGNVGAVLDLIVDIPAPGSYAVELYLTRAPDYAQLKMEVDGQPSSLALEGFAPTVMAPGPMQMGKFSFKEGPRRISFMIVGKYAQSTGYLVGIDRIRLYPAGP